MSFLRHITPGVKGTRYEHAQQLTPADAMASMIADRGASLEGVGQHLDQRLYHTREAYNELEGGRKKLAQTIRDAAPLNPKHLQAMFKDVIDAQVELSENAQEVQYLKDVFAFMLSLFFAGHETELYVTRAMRPEGVRPLSGAPAYAALEVARQHLASQQQFLQQLDQVIEAEVHFHYGGQKWLKAMFKNARSFFTCILSDDPTATAKFLATPTEGDLTRFRLMSIMVWSVRPEIEKRIALLERHVAEESYQLGRVKETARRMIAGEAPLIGTWYGQTESMERAAHESRMRSVDRIARSRW